MFEDPIPSAAGATSAPPPGLFDDLIPAGGDANAAPQAAGTKEQTSIAHESSAPSRASPSRGLFDDLIPNGGAGALAAAAKAAPGRADEQALPRSTAGTDPGDTTLPALGVKEQRAPSVPDAPSVPNATSSSAGLFDDLIPAATRNGAAAGGSQAAAAPEYEPVPDPSLGLKDAKTGIPLVCESKPGRFIAEVAGADDGGLFWKDPETGEIQRPSGNELIRPEGGKYKVYERQDVVRPWAVADMALVRAIVSGFTAARDAFAGNMAPDEVIPRALDAALWAIPGTTFTPLRIGARVQPRPAEPPPEGALPRAGDGAATSPGSTASEPAPRPLSAAVPDTGAGVLRIAGKALETARQSLSDMFEAASREAPKQNKTVDLGIITPEGAARLNGLLREAGIETDVAGFRHTVDAYSARHSFRSHADPITEGARGQVELTAEDWATIPSVLSSPDKISVVGPTKLGRDAIGYWKRVDGYIFYVEEVRTGRETLSAVSMRKYKADEW
jgi:phage-Barnase-EndoU-ColicinE5/D-RelE like nuclease3